MVDDSPIINIKSDEDAAKVYDDFIRTKDIRYFNAFSEYVSSQSFGNIKIKINDVNDLLYKIGDKTILEYLLDNVKMLGYEAKKAISNNIITIKELIRLGKYELLEYTEEESLSFEYENGKSVFEYLLENNLLSSVVISNIWKNYSFIQMMKEKDISLLSKLRGFVLTNNKIGDLSILEFLFQNNLVDEKVVGEIFDEIIFDLCLKYNKKDLLPYLTENVLSINRNGKTILEYLIENNIYPKRKSFYDKTIIKILCDHKLFDYFTDEYQSSLLTKIDEEKTLLEILLENNQTPTTTYYSSKEALDIILKYKRFDLIKHFTLDVLVSLCNLNETYLDIILREKKNGKSINISSINDYSAKIDNVAKYYIIIARNGFINHISDISEYSLTKEGGALLKKLLEIDKDLTLNVIIPKKVKEKVDVAILLRMNGIEQKNIKVNLHSMNIVNDYLNEFNSEYKDAVVSDEARMLLNELKDLMLSDGESDKELINAVIASYTYLISSSNEYGMRELRKLIEIKKNKKEFSFIRSNDGSYYRQIDNSIFLENVNLNTVNHEMGHALYHNLTDQQIPQEYEKILYEIRSNPEVLQKVREYSIRFQEIKERVSQYVDEKYMKTYNLSEEELNKLDEFLSSEKDKRKQAFIKKGYTEDVIDTILSGVYSKDEYIEQDKRIKREELIDVILRSEYGAFISIGDIIDSIFEGKFKSGELLDSEHNKILPAYGHGISYYNRGIDWAFDENIANYSAMVKSADGKEVLTYLKEIVGERFINCIESYYRNNISLSNKDLSEKEEKSL